ncbi:hypothetical protein ACQ4PT_001640 [Festuca glaucescens]
MAAAAILRRRALPSSCRHDVYIRCLLSYSDLHSSVNSANLRFWRGYHNSGKIDLTDMTHPHLWYPNAREKKRKVFLHVGPTNSGKTHNALKRLEASSSGVYCGPLRLLAREVAKRLNEASVPCNLTTGQEREEIEGAKHNSVTVEMADVTTEYQCAVIDEIQMSFMFVVIQLLFLLFSDCLKLLVMWLRFNIMSDYLL